MQLPVTGPAIDPQGGRDRGGVSSTRRGRLEDGRLGGGAVRRADGAGAGRDRYPRAGSPPSWPPVRAPGSSPPAATSRSWTSWWRGGGRRGQGRPSARRVGRGDRRPRPLRPGRGLPVGRAGGGGLRRADSPGRARRCFGRLCQPAPAGRCRRGHPRHRPVPLAEVEKACRRPGATGASSSCPDGGRRPGATAAPGRRWFPLAANARLQPTGGRDGRWRRRHDGTAVG
jgi:hypothetical protein